MLELSRLDEQRSTPFRLDGISKKRERPGQKRQVFFPWDPSEKIRQSVRVKKKILYIYCWSSVWVGEWVALPEAWDDDANSLPRNKSVDSPRKARPDRELDPCPIRKTLTMGGEHIGQMAH